MTFAKRGKYTGGGKPGRKLPPQLLQDMRAVYREDKAQDKTPGRKALREKLEKDPDGFMKLLKEAEKDWLNAWQKRQVPEGEGKEKAGEVDVGTGKCVEILRNIVKGLTDAQSG